jgi:Histidine kinase-, DNA gyrase B-, and HSP90-like ATPase
MNSLELDVVICCIKGVIVENPLKQTQIQRLAEQRAYVKQKMSEGFDFSLVVGAAFVRGIRDIGYKSVGTAINELVDNSIEAGASKVEVVLGFDESAAKQTAVSVLDDGHGMDADMLRLAVIWGGTHREGSRAGFGRYGYGLPSAAVSIGRRYTVYSRTIETKWHEISIDLDEIEKGVLTHNGRIVVPAARPTKLPEWLHEAYSDRFGSSKHGTVVVVDNLDRGRKTAKKLRSDLLENIGITYRNLLRQIPMWVDGEQAQAVDPLFLMPEARFYDLDEERAEPLPSTVIEVKARDGRPGGLIRVRYAYLPPTFQRRNKSSDGSSRGNLNERFPIMESHNGFIVMRNGRQIDVVSRNPFFNFNNYARNLKIELDFDAGLDEEFGVTTSKQQITLTDRAWDLLKENRVISALEGMRRRFEKERVELKTIHESADQEKRASEQAMEQAERVIKRSKTVKTVEKEIVAQRALDKEIRRRADEAKVAPATIEEAVREEVRAHPYKVQREANPEGSFYRVEQRGGQVVVFINTAHHFFTDLYGSPTATPELRAGLEVLLFVLGTSELDASSDYELFYRQERRTWSERLEIALTKLGEVHETKPMDETISSGA